MARKGWLLPDVEDHNGEQWLTVKYCELLVQPKYHLGRRNKLLHPGWYVIRTCPCHFGERVTLSYPTRERAEHARNTILSVGGSR